MQRALRAAGWLIAGAAILAGLWLSLPVFSLKEELAPPAIDAPPPDVSAPGAPIDTVPDEPGAGGPPPGGDAAVDWARIANTNDPWALDAYLRAYADSPFAEQARRRLMALTPAPAATEDTGDAGGRDPGPPREAGPPPFEPAGRDGDPAEAALRAQFRAADIAFNAPAAMMFRQTARLQLVLSPQTSGVAPESRLSAGLPGDVVTVEGVDYALRMQATLSGQDFEIDPEGAIARTVLADRPTTWDWTVKPLTYGPGKPLILRLEAVIARDGRDLPPVEIETFSATVLVNVTLLDRAVEVAKAVSPLHATVVAVGGTAVAVIGWLWRLRRKPKPAPAQQGNGAPPAAGPDSPGPVSR
jgi:hypothetical protein